MKNNGIEGILRAAQERLDGGLAPHAADAESEMNYFKNHIHRMAYRTFRRQGFYIGSGAIEGACRHVVAQRTKISGARWHPAGAENVLAFRSIIKSNLFDAFCKFKAVA